MSQTPITIVEWTPEWEDEFRSEQSRIRDAIGQHISAIEHIGSTAVPDLGAKPVIDILVGVERLAEAENCIEPLEHLGYEYCPEFEDEMPNRRYFRKTASGRHTHHLHVVAQGGDFWERHLLFRDYLREHDDVVRQYDELKRELAEKHPQDIAAYTEAKTEFIESVVADARAYYDRE